MAAPTLTDDDIQELLRQANVAVDAAGDRHVAAGGNVWEGPGIRLSNDTGTVMRRYYNLPKWDESNLTETATALRDIIDAAQ